MSMYVTTRAARIAGMYVPAGTILPSELRVPGHLLTSGIVVRLPNTLLPWPGDDEVTEPEPEPDPEPEPEPEPEAEPIQGEVIVGSMTLDDIEVDHLHQGQGWYELPDGERVRGKQNAQRALADIMARNTEED